MSTRVIHLELAGEPSTDNFIEALTRFISMRNNRKQIRSDNCTNFVGAKREMRDNYNNYNNEKLPTILTKTISNANLIHHHVHG